MKVTSSILYLKVTYDEETEEWNICRTSTLFYQIIKLRSVDFKFKLDTEFDEVCSSNVVTQRAAGYYWLVKVTYRFSVSRLLQIKEM